MPIDKNQIHGIAMPPAISIAAACSFPSIQQVMAVIVIAGGAVIQPKSIAVGNGQAGNLDLTQFRGQTLLQWSTASRQRILRSADLVVIIPVSNVIIKKSIPPVGVFVTEVAGQ